MYRKYRLMAKKLLDRVNSKKMDLARPDDSPGALEKELKYVITARKYNESANMLLRALLKVSQLIKELQNYEQVLRDYNMKTNTLNDYENNW